MREQHLDEALTIRAEINHLTECKRQIESGIWTLCKIGAKADELEYASVALNANEDRMCDIARRGLLADVATEIAKRRTRLKALGVELEDSEIRELSNVPHRIIVDELLAQQ